MKVYLFTTALRAHAHSLAALARPSFAKTERKDARIAAMVVGTVTLSLILPELVRFLHIEMPSWTYIPDWMWQYLF
jgi:hypothetical protein